MNRGGLTMEQLSPTRASRLLLLPVRRPWATLAAAAVVLGLACWSIASLRFNPRLEALLPGDSPSAAAFHRVTREFHLLDEALVLVESDDDDGGDDVDDQERRAELLLAFAARFEARLAADAESRDLVESVEFRASAEMMRFAREVAVPNAALYLDDAAFDALLARFTAESMAEQMVRNEALLAAGSPAADPIAKQMLRDPLRLHEIIGPALAPMRAAPRTWRGGEAYLSHDARALLIRVTAKGPATDMDFTRRIVALLERSTVAAEPGAMRVDFGGAYPIARLSERVIRADMIGTVTGSIILMQLLYLVAYRRLASFALVFLPVACGMAAGLGLYGVLFGEISPISAGIGAILAGLGDDFSIHYLSHYESCRRRGMTVEQAADIRGGLGLAMLHACGTSMVGFLAIAVSAVPALRDFAVLGALGLLGALAGTVTVLPAVLALLERFRAGRELAPPRFGPVLVERVVAKRGVQWVAIAMLLIAAIIAGARWSASPWFTTDLHAMHPQPNAPLQTHQRIADRFGLATESPLIHLAAPSSRELLQLAVKVRDRLESPALRDRGVAGVIGPATFLPDPATAEQRAGQLRAFDRDAVIARFQTAVNESAFNPAAFGDYESFLMRLLNPPSTPDMAALSRYPSLARLMLPSSRDSTGEPTQAIATVRLARVPADQVERDQLFDALRSALADVPSASLTGLGILGRDMERAVRRELPRMGLVAGGLVLFSIVVMFRRPGRIVLAMLPLAGAAVFLLAAFRITGTGLNMVNMAAIPILFGIAIDSGIFLVGARRDADVHAMAERGHAVTLSTLTTILGFGSLMTASVPAMASLGLALAAGMTGCWTASVIVMGMRPAAKH